MDVNGIFFDRKGRRERKTYILVQKKFTNKGCFEMNCSGIGTTDGQ